MVLRMKNLFGIICWGYVGDSQKNPTFRWVFAKNNIEREINFRFKGGLARKSWVVILREGEVDNPMHTMLYIYVYFLNIFFLFFINKEVFLSFSFPFCDQISNNCNRILTNKKLEQVMRNCIWNCMSNSSVINIR